MSTPTRVPEAPTATPTPAVVTPPAPGTPGLAVVGPALILVLALIGAILLVWRRKMAGRRQDRTEILHRRLKCVILCCVIHLGELALGGF